MRKFLELLAPFYLGFALSTFANIWWYQWEFYAIIVPFYILTAVPKIKPEDE